MNKPRPGAVHAEDLARVLRQACLLLAHPASAGLSLFDALERAADSDLPLLDDAALVVTRVMRVPPGPPGGARSLRAALALWHEEHDGQEMPVTLAHGLLVQALAAL